MATSPAVVPPGRSAVPGPPRCLKTDLGGTVVELRLDDISLLETMRRRYRGFLTRVSRTDLLLVQDTAAHSLVDSREAAPVPVPARADAGHVDGLVRTRLPELAAPSLLVHGTLLTDGERTYLCCGPSGAGKSTLAALLGHRALCDELALVRPSGGTFEGVALPYWKARPGSGPLAGVFLLEHAPEHRRRRLAPGEAVRELHRHVYWPTGSPAAMEAALGTLAALVPAVALWRLGFRKDPGVWKLITEPAP